MPPFTRRPYRSKADSVGIVCEILSHGPLTTVQVADIAKANRVTTLGWLHDGLKAGEIRRSKHQGCRAVKWSLVFVCEVAEPPPEGPLPFESLCQRLKPRRWHTATELSAYRDALSSAVDAELLETCRRWFQGRRGRPTTLYKLTLGGELRAGRKPGWF